MVHSFKRSFLVKDVAKSFLNESIIQQIDKQLSYKTSLTKKTTLDYHRLSLPENEQIKKNKKSIKSTRGSYLHRADDLLYLGESQLERNVSASANYLRDAATMYAFFDAHEKYAEAVCNLADIKYSLNPEENISPMLISLDTIISFYSRKQGMKSQNNSSKIKEKEYRKKIRDMKNKGQLKPGDRWPRKKIDSYHTPLVNLKTAVKISYLKTDLLAKLGPKYEKEFSSTYNRAIELLNRLPKSQQDYISDMQNSFVSMKHLYNNHFSK